MKRLLSILFALCLVVALSLSVSAESTNKLTYAVGASAPTVSANTEFTVLVDITENTGICWLKAVVTYDSSVLSYVGASTDSSAFGSAKIKVNNKDGKAIVVLGEMTVVFEQNPTIYTNTGRFVALTFKVNPAAAAGETKIDVATSSGDALKIVDGVSDLDYTVTSASTTVKILSNATHTCVAGEEIRQNEKPATCNEMGSYESVYNCTICGNEMSRKTVVIPINEDHIHGEATKENIVAGTCQKEGTYDMVTRCTRCGKIVKQETLKGTKAEHEAGTPEVIYTASTCVKPGTFIEVYTCKHCGKELDRKTNELPLSSHSAKAPVKENVVHATCSSNGSYDNVVYCSVCNEKLSSETITETMVAHNPGKAVEENRKEPTDCLTMGSYDYVVYCTACNKELSRLTQTIPVLAHKPGDPPTETTPQTCVVCGYILKGALGHTHKWGTEFTSNHDGHWYACSGCGEKKSYAEHSFDNACDATCNACGMTRTVADHKYDNACDDACNICGLKRTITHKYDNNCDATCNVCGATRTPADHIYGSWTTVTAPTATENGMRQRTCNVCGYADKEAIPATGEVTTEPPVTTESPVVTTEPPVVTTEPPVVTTEEPDVSTDEPTVTTDEPEVTTAPEVTTDPSDVTTEPKDPDKGCKSAVSMGIALIAILGSALIIKKRD